MSSHDKYQASLQLHFYQQMVLRGSMTPTN